MGVRQMSEMTLGEVKGLCRKHSCKTCGFDGVTCENGFSRPPMLWNLEDEADSSQNAARTEPAKPRICDLLGVDVGDPFTVDGYCGRLSLNADGTFHVLSGDGKNSTYSVMQAIENPTRVHRSVLTEPEIAICKALGAKWVTNTGEAEDVYLWSEKPTWDNDLETYIGEKWLGEVDRCLFSSIYPGDCIEVPE